MDMNVVTSTATIISPQINSAINGILGSLLQLALLGLTSLLGWGVKTWLANMNSSWKRAIAERLVKFAENRLTGDEEKRKYVANQLHVHFPRITEDEAQHLLEEAVVNLQVQLASGIVAIEAPVIPPK